MIGAQLGNFQSEDKKLLADAKMRPRCSDTHYRLYLALVIQGQKSTSRLS